MCALSLIEEGVFVKGQLLELMTVENLQQDYFVCVCRKVAVLGEWVELEVVRMGLELVELDGLGFRAR